ncbi:hypothetical protein TIFTF001_035002 [Ficus carica]|uniref:Uncharacterized protein n=1 Tax=Ficus carica TaxID=3494 RepID=A0AA88E1F8_FICCA|nr:hypothetical protein TIFTF001_034989 [Ficus carica]GMN65932.1 hypothetical protein TIFTF001_035002 [Ficus carica]
MAAYPKPQAMAQPNAVEIVEVCKVAPPPTADVHGPKSLPLTFFDIRWLRFPPIERLFFYETSTQNNTSTFFFDSILPRLKHSLSLTLLHFLPLAGNLTWPPTSPKPGIEYSESDGVSLTVAVSNADFRRLSGTDVFCESTEYSPLVPKLSASHDQVAVLAIQVTVFPNHGFSIGVTNHHSVFDGKSLILFVKSWAHTCRSLGPAHRSDGHDQSTIFLQLPPELKPVFDRDYIKDSADLGTIFSNQWRNIDGPDNRSVVPWEVKKIQPAGSVRGTFQMPREKIEKLKQLVRVEKMENYKDNEQHFPNIHVSTFSLTCAYTLACLAKAEEVTDDKILFVFSVDLRSRLEAPIPTTYFGNCVAGKVIGFEREALLGKEGLVVALRAISDAIKGLEKGPLNGAENWVTLINEKKASSLRVYSIASSPRFEVYSTDFGWGRPRKVDVCSIDKTGAISLSDNINGNGVEIGLVLRKHHMEAFSSLFAKGLESL